MPRPQRGSVIVLATRASACDQNDKIFAKSHSSGANEFATHFSPHGDQDTAGFINLSARPPLGNTYIHASDIQSFFISLLVVMIMNASILSAATDGFLQICLLSIRY